MAYINIKFQTDQSGANSNVCSGSDIKFNFSLTDTYNLAGAYVSLKKGSGTTGSISAIVYDQPNGGGSIVATSTVLAASITQSYTEIPFLFSGVTLSPGISYSLVLRSSSSCMGNNPYSMKSGNFQVLNADTGGLLNTGYGISASILNNASVSADATRTPAPSPTPTSSATPTPTVSATSSVTPTPTISETPSVTPTPTVSSTSLVTPTPTASVTPTITPTITVTSTPGIQNKSRVGVNRIKFRLGNKAIKLYSNGIKIYDPNNDI